MILLLTPSEGLHQVPLPMGHHEQEHCPGGRTRVLNRSLLPCWSKIWKLSGHTGKPAVTHKSARSILAFKKDNVAIENQGDRDSREGDMDGAVKDKTHVRCCKADETSHSPFSSIARARAPQGHLQTKHEGDPLEGPKPSSLHRRPQFSGAAVQRGWS